MRTPVTTPSAARLPLLLVLQPADLRYEGGLFGGPRPLSLSS
jgi:hypothetical protein